MQVFLLFGVLATILSNKLSLYISGVGVFRKVSTCGLLQVVGYGQFFTFGYVFEKNVSLKFINQVFLHEVGSANLGHALNKM